MADQVRGHSSGEWLYARSTYLVVAFVLIVYDEAPGALAPEATG